MTETEKKALALVNEVATPGHVYDLQNLAQSRPFKALLRAIEQHEAYKREVSDAVTGFDEYGTEAAWEKLSRFIIAKPDPLVEVINDADNMVRKPVAPSYAEALRTAIEARGGRIVWEGE